MAEQIPKFENLKVGKKIFRVVNINYADLTLNSNQKQEEKAAQVYTNWRNTEQNQKQIESEIKQKKNLKYPKNQENQSQWDGQWGTDIRALNASELAATIDTGDYSHFVSIPLYRDDKLIKKLNDFKGKVNEVFNNRYQSNLLNDMRTAHITLLMLKLNTQERQKKAVECIKNSEAVIRVLAEGLKKFNIKGLGYFGKNEKQASTIYAKIDDPNFVSFLNEVTNVLVRDFMDFGLINDEDLSHIKKNSEGKYICEQLHISLLKAAKQKNKSSTFDATEVLDQFKHFEFYSAKFSTLDISTRGEFMASNGYYLPITSFTIAI
ncbi:hypothetical protein ABPG74_007806 [Tetrahymena malaccensis]